MPDAAFWPGQRVLLTGHTGFKGAWLSLWLESLGARVVGLSLAPETAPNLISLLAPFAGAESRLGDIRDPAAVQGAVTAARPTILIHMAAQALVRRSYREPIETFDVNVMGTIRLLDAVRQSQGLQAALVVTSDKVYRNDDQGRAFAEADPLGGHDPYSASKAATEIAVASWSDSFLKTAGVRVATARAGNVIGGGDWSEDRLIPDLWRAHHAGAAPLLRRPEATRPWQHVLEPLAGYLDYAQALASAARPPPPSLNFGPHASDVMTVGEVADVVLPALGENQGWRRDGVPGPAEMQYLALDPGLAQASLGWRPRLATREALAWTADWYRRFDAGEPARRLCLEQIAAYEALSRR